MKQNLGQLWVTTTIFWIDPDAFSPTWISAFSRWSVPKLHLNFLSNLVMCISSNLINLRLTSLFRPMSGRRTTRTHPVQNHNIISCWFDASNVSLLRPKKKICVVPVTRPTLSLGRRKVRLKRFHFPLLAVKFENEQYSSLYEVFYHIVGMYSSSSEI